MLTNHIHINIDFRYRYILPTTTLKINYIIQLNIINIKINTEINARGKKMHK